MYEANPMAFIVEQAGGAATDGQQRILDIAAEERCTSACAVFLGSKNEVERVTRTTSEVAAAAKQKAGTCPAFLSPPLVTVTSGAC